MTLAAFATYAPLESGKVLHRNPFPYPEHGNPTPHQIFHLPFGATQMQIKSRCMSTASLWSPRNFDFNFSTQITSSSEYTIPILHMPHLFQLSWPMTDFDP